MSSIAAKLRNTQRPAFAPGVQYMDYTPYGACKEIFRHREREVVLSGPAGTGKSRACLEKVNFVCEKYPRARCIMARKTRRSLTQSGMITFEQKVLANPNLVPFHGGDQEYRYPNASVLAVAGLDDPRKIFSSEWDVIYIQQAEELLESDWDSLFRSLRSWVVPYQQVLGDCNPDAPTHWIKGRAALGFLTLLESRHEDNPELWDETNQTWTERGKIYIQDLDALMGVRKARLRFGQWRGAEGTVYEEVWDRALHVIDRFVTAPLDQDQVPASWPRYWVVDFGFTNPFVWQAWAEDPDGRLFRYKEIYKTKVPVEDHAAVIKKVTAHEPKPVAVVCDHDAEGRATLEKHLDIRTIGAWKGVSEGIQGVGSRLRKAGDGKPRLFYLRDSVVELDRTLTDKHLPACTEDEFDVYVWDTSNNRKQGEEPVKKYDHGCDSTRYLVAHVDKVGKNPPKMFGIVSMTKSGGSGDTGSLVQPSKWRMDGGSNLGTRWGQ